jgi:hypothetical protein
MTFMAGRWEKHRSGRAPRSGPDDPAPIPAGRLFSLDPVQERLLALLREAGETWARASGAALDAPTVQGIMRFSGGDAVLRLSVRVDPSRRLDAENDLRRRIKATFDRERLSAVGV